MSYKGFFDFTRRKREEDEEYGTYEPPKLVNAYDLLQKPVKRIDNLVNPILPRVGVCCLAGTSEIGKSTFLRQLAMAIGMGRSEFLGFELNPRRYSVLIISTEDGEHAVAENLYRISKNEVLPNDYLDVDFLFDCEDILYQIDELAGDNKRDLIIVDGFADVFGGSMNDANDVRHFLNVFKEKAERYQCLIMFMHHIGKNKEGMMPDKSLLLGSQAIEAKMRVVLELRPDRKRPDHLHLCVVKGNYLKREEKELSYVLKVDDDYRFHGTDERCKLSEIMRGNSYLKKKVLALREKRLTQQEIADELEISQSTVSKLLKS